MNKTEMADRLAARTGVSKGAARDAADGHPRHRRSACRWRGCPSAGIQDLRHQEPASPLRTQPKDRRGRFDIGVHIADVQGGEDAEGHRERGRGIVTVRREKTATGSAAKRLQALSS